MSDSENKKRAAAANVGEQIWWHWHRVYTQFSEPAMRRVHLTLVLIWGTGLITSLVVSNIDDFNFNVNNVNMEEGTGVDRLSRATPLSVEAGRNSRDFSQRIEGWRQPRANGDDSLVRSLVPLAREFYTDETAADNRDRNTIFNGNLGILANPLDQADLDSLQKPDTEIAIEEFARTQGFQDPE